MALLSKIRERSALVIGLIGLAIIAFVISDAISSNPAIFSDRDTSVGTIEGKKIEQQEFSQKLEVAKVNYMNQRQTNRISAQDQQQLNDQVWNQMVYQNIFNEEFEKLGLQVSAQELFDMVQGDDPHPAVKQNFTDPESGEFRRNDLMNFLQNLDRPEAAQYRESWFQFEDALVEDRIREKYNGLIAASFYANSLEAKLDFHKENAFVDMDYVFKAYSSIKEDEVKIEESDLKAYYNENKDNYKQDQETRTFQYVMIDIAPSAEDTAEARREIESLKSEFQEATNDSTFVRVNSDAPYEAKVMDRSEANSTNPDYDRFFEEGVQVGDVFGPYEERGVFKLIKISDIMEDSVSNFRARHILIKPEGETDEDTANAMKKARELQRDIRGGADFEALAAEFGTDGTKDRGGDLGWYRDGAMVDEFNETVKNARVGEVKVVKTQFGAHVVEKTGDADNRKVKITTLTKEVYPTRDTYAKAFEQAKNFRSKAGVNPESFGAVASELGLNPRTSQPLTASTSQLPGVEDAREMIRWAFDANVNEISDIIDVDESHVVLKLIEVSPKGYTPFEALKDEIRPLVLEEKRKEMLYQSFKEAIGGKEDLADMATALSVEKRSANRVNLQNPTLNENMNEHRVVGAALGMSPGKTSRPIKGSNGVFVINVTNVKKPEGEENAIAGRKSQIIEDRSARAKISVMNAMTESADVEDRRYKFY